MIRKTSWYLAAIGLFLATIAHGTSLQRFDLAGLAGNADKIYRGTVLSVEPGTIEVGGGELPTVTVRVRVDETFKGNLPAKGDATVAEFRMIASMKDGRQVGNARHFSVLYDVPSFEVGSDYLLFTTAPSAVGLSTTVGLGQGAFKVVAHDKDEFATNGYGNLGLGLGSGPLSYSTLAAELNQLLGQ